MFSFAVNIVELQYVYAAMDWIQAHLPGFEGWGGMATVESALNYRHDLKKGKVFLSTDFSHMDTSFGRAQVGLYLEAVLPMFKPEYRERYRQVCLGKLDLPIIIGTLTTPGYSNPDGSSSRKARSLVVLTGVHGKTSGEGDTNFAESVDNCLLQLDISIQPKVEMRQAGVDGDDAESIYDRAPDNLAEVFQRRAAAYGFTANAEKQLQSTTTLHYLQRVFDQDETDSTIGVLGAYPFILATNSAKNPERSSYLTGVQRAVRVVEIYENCFHHPEFDDIVDFAVAGSPQLEAIREDPSRIDELTKYHSEMMAATHGVVASSHGHQYAGFRNYAFVKKLLGEKVELSFMSGGPKQVDSLEDF